MSELNEQNQGAYFLLHSIIVQAEEHGKDSVTLKELRVLRAELKRKLEEANRG